MLCTDKYMFIYILIVTAIIITKVSEIKSYQLITTKDYSLKRKNSIVLSNFKTRASTSDEWQEDDSAIVNNDDLPNIHRNIYNNLDQALGETITARAIDTASFYMLEFRDDISQKWMLSFLDYKNVGFIDGNWQLFLNEMIKLDSQQVKVYMDPPRVSSRHQPSKDEENLKAVYIHDFEPRKIAHKLLAIREDISNELIEDFGCIALENKEAVKFANNWITSGKEYAEINRGLTRSSDGSSTPFRGKTYKEISLMMTNVALDIIRAELNIAKDRASLLLIENILEQVAQSGEGLDQIHKMLLENTNPQRFLEEMCYCGLTQNNLKDNNSNFLKISKSLEALAKTSIQILMEQSKELRYLYKLIKDLGGFKSFDLRRKRTEVRIVNMKEEEELELKQQQQLQSTLNVGDNSVHNQNATTTTTETVSEAISKLDEATIVVEVDNEDDQTSIFDSISIGPIMM